MIVLLWLFFNFTLLLILLQEGLLGNGLYLVVGLFPILVGDFFFLLRYFNVQNVLKFVFIFVFDVVIQYSSSSRPEYIIVGDFCESLSLFIVLVILVVN
jgi:hypothetical protein